MPVMRWIVDHLPKVGTTRTILISRPIQASYPYCRVRKGRCPIPSAVCSISRVNKQCKCVLIAHVIFPPSHGIDQRFVRFLDPDKLFLHLTPTQQTHLCLRTWILIGVVEKSELVKRLTNLPVRRLPRNAQNRILRYTSSPLATPHMESTGSASGRAETEDSCTTRRRSCGCAAI